MIAETRARIDAPIIPMTYAAILEAYGYERFVTDSRAAGATSAIIVDLPVEEHHEVPRVQLVAPTSTDERIDLCAANTDGWLYLVSLTGTTGARAEVSPALAGLVERTRARTDLPLYAGFGISTPEHAAAVAGRADGVVVGSRAVQVAEEGPAALRDYVGSLAARSTPCPGGLVDAPVTVACIQAEPVVLDREATVDKLERLTAEAAAHGAQLLVFPESFIPAYPSSVWAKALAGWAEPGATEAFALLARESVAVPGEAEARIGAAAREHGVWIVTGVTEVDPERPSTLYNTLLTHAPDGSLAARHRKLVPTNHERLVWGQGDGAGLRAIPTPLGRIGGLICWENYMPLARFALYESGVEIYIASTADDGDAWQATLVHLARESRAFVIAPCHFQRAAAYPDDFPLRRLLEGVDTIGRGGSAVLAPGGAYLAGPLYGEEGILYAELDPAVLWAERQRFDPAGHYHRPDVLGLRLTPLE